MKKLYAAVAMAIIAASASAQTLYFKGSANELSWDDGVDLAVEKTGDSYTVDLTDLTGFKFSTVSTANGGWAAFDAAALFGDADATSEEANLGKPITLIIGDANNNVPWKGDYHIVVAGDLSTITLTTTTPKPVGAQDIYLRGGMNNWGNDGIETLASWKFSSPDDGITYTFTCAEGQSIPEGTEFKIGDSSWGSYNYGAGDEVTIDESFYIWYYNAGNALMAEDFDGTIVVRFTYPEGEEGEEPLGPNKGALVALYPAEAGVAAVAVDANAPKEYFNLQGVRVANPENGLFIVRQGNKATKVLVK